MGQHTTVTTLYRGGAEAKQGQSVLFVVVGNERRSGFVDGHSMRFGGSGLSGTDQSVVLVAEWLAATGRFRVVVATANSRRGGTVVHGVTYTDMGLAGVEDRGFDVVVGMLWFEGYADLPVDAARVRKLVVWNHLPYVYGVAAIRAFVRAHPGCELHLVDVSRWCAGQTRKYHAALASSVEHAGVDSHVIHNPLAFDVATGLHAAVGSRVRRSMVFHAFWDRGGDFALRVHKRLAWPDASFHACGYLMDHVADPAVTNHVSLDKSGLFALLARCEYLVYPMFSTDRSEIRQDTFACAVAEALAMGVIVFAYPLGALPELYGDACVWVQPPPDVAERASGDPIVFDASVDVEPFARAILELDGDEPRKAALREAGRRVVREVCDAGRIGAQWDVVLRTRGCLPSPA